MVQQAWLVLTLLGVAILHPASAAGQSTASPKATVESTAALDLNTASAAELKSLPGIGDAYSAAIIKGRPYKRKDELVDRKILPASVYEKVKARIIARQK